MHFVGQESFARSPTGAADPVVVAAKTPSIARASAPGAMRPVREITEGRLPRRNLRSRNESRSVSRGDGAPAAGGQRREGA